MKKGKPVNCYRCEYFSFCEGARFPYKCRLYLHDFMVIPSLAVLRATGRHCDFFTAKTDAARPDPVIREDVRETVQKNAQRCIDCDRDCHPDGDIFFCPKYSQKRVDIQI